MVLIYDPGRNLPNIPSDLHRKLGHGLLIVPDRRVPIHPASLRHLADSVTSNGFLAFAPEIPAATKLGMPRYAPLYYWVPFGHEWKLLFEMSIFKKLLRKSTPFNFQQRYSGKQITNTTLKERTYYLANQFDKITPKPI